MLSENVPENRCGYVVHPEDARAESLYGDMESERWHERNRAVCCWRNEWNGTGRCIWHAEGSEKSAVALQNARRDGPERLDGIRLSGVRVPASVGLSFAGCVLHGGDFSDADLRGTNFADADLTDADFRNADLRKARFENADLYHTDLGNANFRHANLDNADLSHAAAENARFLRATLERADLFRSDFERADLRTASLVDVELHNAALGGATLRRADLRRANLYDADLREADLRDANLEDGSLDKTDLRNVDLRNARLYRADLSEARIDSDTEFGTTVAYEERTDLDGWDVSPTDAAVWTYLRLRNLHEAHGLTVRGRQYQTKADQIRHE